MTNNPYSDPTNPYANADSSAGSPPSGFNPGGQQRALGADPRLEERAQGQWETLGKGSNGGDWTPQQWNQHSYGYVQTQRNRYGGYAPTVQPEQQPSWNVRREFPPSARAGVLAMIGGIVVYLVGVFLPFASSDDLVVSSTGAEIGGSFTTTNLLESTAPAWISLGLLAIALGILGYFVFVRKVQDTLAKGIVVGTALTAGTGLVIFLLSIAVDGGLRNFYDAGGSMGVGQIVMFVGAGLTFLGAVLTTIGAATEKRSRGGAMPNRTVS